MKAKLIFLFFTVFCLNAHAQNWSTAWAGGVQYYLGSGELNSNQVVKMDSTNGYARVYFTKIFYKNPNSNSAAWCNLLNHTSYYGQYILQKNVGEEIFINMMGDSLFLKTDAELNDSWAFFRYENGSYIKATVNKKEYQTILGELDSVKQITLSYVDSVGNVVNKPYGGLTFAISKNHSWIKRFALYAFPFYENLSGTIDSLVGSGLPYNGICPSFNQEVFNYDIGDEWHYVVSSTSESNGSFIKKVINKEVYSNSIKYTFFITQKARKGDSVWSYMQDKVVINDTIPVQTPQMGIGLFTSFLNGSSFINISENSAHIDGSDSCLKITTYPGSYSKNYILGVDEYHSYSSMGGVQWNDKTITYIKKGNKIWGTPFNFGSLGIDATVGSFSMAVYPNPATDRIFLDEKGDYFITDIAGKKLIEAKGVMSINITNLPMGIYFICNAAGGRVKIVKQ